MKFLLLVAALSLFGSSCRVCAQEVDNAGDLASKSRELESALMVFTNAIVSPNRNGELEGNSVVSNAHLSKAIGQVWFKQFKQDLSGAYFSVKEMPSTFEKDEATSIVKYIVVAPLFDSREFEEKIHWKLSPTEDVTNPQWKIITPNEEPMYNNDYGAKPFPLGSALWSYSHPKAADEKTLGQFAQNGLAHINGGIMALTDESRPLAIRLNASNYQRKLKPYLFEDAEKSFTVPGTKRTWMFNEQLNEVNLEKIQTEQPEKVEKLILFYDGKAQILNYLYGGKAAILLVSGDVKLITPIEAKSLIWRP